MCKFLTFLVDDIHNRHFVSMFKKVGLKHVESRSPRREDEAWVVGQRCKFLGTFFHDDINDGYFFSMFKWIFKTCRQNVHHLCIRAELKNIF